MWTICYTCQFLIDIYLKINKSNADESMVFWHWVGGAFSPSPSRKNSCGNLYNTLSISGPFRWWNCAENVSAATSFSPLCTGPIREHLVLFSNWLSTCGLLGLPGKTQHLFSQSFHTTKRKKQCMHEWMITVGNN